MYIDDKAILETIERKENSGDARKECCYYKLMSGEWLGVETTYKKVTKDWGDDWVVDTVTTSVSNDRPDEDGKEEKLKKLAEAIRGMNTSNSSY